MNKHFSQNTDMLRHQRLETINIDYRHFVSILREELPKIDDSLQHKRRGSTDGWLSCALTWSHELARMTHLQYELPFGDTLPYIKKGRDVAIEYFYGNWRESYQKFPASIYTRDDCRKELRWDEEFQHGILCALWIGDEKNLAKLASWVDDDLVDYGIYDCSEVDAWFLVLLAKFLKGESLQTNSHIVEIIRKKNRRRPKLLLDVLESIENVPIRFGEVLAKYVKYYVKSEFNPEETSPLDCVSKMASVLWATAKRVDVVMPLLQEEIMDRIMTSESIGLT